MRSTRERLGLGTVLAACFSLCLTATAHAQGPAGPGGMTPGSPTGPGVGPGQRKEKKEGPAEEAPKDKQALRPIEPVPAQPKRLRRIQLFELHGFMRMRGDYFHRLDLGHAPNHAVDAADAQINNKFFRPPAETPELREDGTFDFNEARCFVQLSENGVNPDRASQRCGRRNGFPSANMRLRLEPTLHVTDTVRVHAQIDALDNLVLGSTPDSYAWDNPYAPINFYTRSQTAPTSGINSFSDSILVKRAWGHIRFGFGLDLRFGRMPWHWGMGIVANDGNGYYRGETGDIVRMLDMDYGDSVDSLRFAFDFGKDRRKAHTVAASWDWASSGPTTSQLLGPEWDSGGRVGQEFSAEKFDNVYQWSLSLERRDLPEMLQRKLSLSQVVVNYGLMNWLRYQPLDAAIGSPGLGDGLGTNGEFYDDATFPDPVSGGGAPIGNGDLDGDGNSGLNNYANTLVRRRAILYTPDIWFRVNWRTLRVELEAAANVGRYYHRNLDDDVDALGGSAYFDTITATERTGIASFGYALEFKYGFLQDRLHIGLDQGLALGDSSAARDQNPQNPVLSGGGNVNNFRFNPAYMQDLLLFRELLGTVSNAAYFKPWGAFYFFDRYFSARLDVLYAFAHQKQSTPGGRRSYGIELNGALRYHDQNEPIFFQIQYGVMFPLRAFNRPRNLYPGYSELIPPRGGDGDARAAQTVQGQIGIRF